ncbi:MAG: hypothetical protein LKF52_05830 [Butyrivibrio sp.]|nr:hypothetical protein [Butyrivibrio sp.]
MRIAASNVNLNADRAYQSVNAGYATAELNFGQRWTEAVKRERDTYQSSMQEIEQYEISDQGSNYLDMATKKSQAVQNEADNEQNIDFLASVQIQLLQAILKLLGTLYGDSMSELAGSLQSELSGLQENASSGYSVITQVSGFAEHEETQFTGTGTALTEDGRTISFGIGIGMSRSFMQYTGVQVRQQTEMTDPLVINVGAGVTKLSDQKFYFDLDCDGEEEKISKLCDGSGFLAIDKNGDGKINDGSELFGTESGDGFDDLKSYDEDENGWIDENDGIWNELKVWMKNEGGEDSLISLKNEGVGAIYLGETQTQFTQLGSDFQSKGKIQSTGVFLHEDGRAGTIQHIDLAAERA